MGVIVIGGGFAGVAAACRLAGGDHPPLLLERGGNLGGRAGSFYLSRQGETIDYGQHVLMRCCTAATGFLQRIGASSAVRFQRDLSIPIIYSAKVSPLRSSLLPGPLHLAPSLLSYRPLPFGERLSALRTGLALFLSRGQSDLTFERWLAAHGETDAAIERLWDPICLATLNAPAREVSLSAARMVLREGLFRPGAADVGLFVLPFADVFASARRYIEERGGVVRTLSTVRRILIEGGTAIGVETADGERIEAEGVIAAVPASELASILPEGAIDIPNLRFSPIVDVHFWFDRPIMEEEFLIGVGSPVQGIFDLTRIRGESRTNHIVLSQSWAVPWIDRPVDEIAARLLDSLGDLLPAVRRATLIDRLVIKHREATFVPALGVDRIRPPAKGAVFRLYLAGDWTATGWPATIEGAVRSGINAAARWEGELEPSWIDRKIGL